MECYIEWFDEPGGIIRIFGDNKEYGDEYCWAATIKKISNEVIEILGVATPLTFKQARAIKKELKKLGFKKILINKFKNGNIIKVELNNG